MRDILLPEDYEEPRCPLDVGNSSEKHITRIPTHRVIEKLDEHLSRNDFAAAERHLHYWRGEAEAGNDTHGLITVDNELIGLYRRLGRRDDSYAAAERVLKSVESMEGRITAATAYINAATAYKAFGEADRALPLYRRAREIYESRLSRDDTRMAALYNNMGLCLVDLSMFDEANELYRRAIEITRESSDGNVESAITYMNMANAVEAEFGLESGEESINELLTKAEGCLEADVSRTDGYYAYACEKSAPTFRYYGWFAYADELSERVKKIYAGN